jgi:hypothetical protein
MRKAGIISVENIKFNRKVGEDPANLDKIILNLVKKRKLI